MSLFKLDALIGEGTHGVVRRVGNQPISASNGPRKRKGGAPGANLGAMIQGSPEVMVKVSGFGRGKGVRNALEYIARDGKLELERADGSKVKGKEEIGELAREWRQADRRKHPRQRETVNLVLSMPPGTDPAKVLKASRAFAADQFGGKRDFVLVQHTDEKHPHVHIITRMAGHDGSRLNPRKADLQGWREAFAEQLRELDVECAATPRRARGIAKKPQAQILVHMRKRGLVPRVDVSEIQDAKKQLEGGSTARPWDQAIQKRQDKIRSIYRDAANYLKANTDSPDRALGNDLEAFIRAMPPPKTRRENLLEKLRSEAERSVSDRALDAPSDRSL